MAASGYDERLALSRSARAMHRAARAPSRLPSLFFVTDPKRTPDPVSIAKTLPSGTGVVFRHFGARSAAATAEMLAEICSRRRLILLIAADEKLAERIGADGVHLPQRMIGGGRAIRRRHRDWLLTAAAHDRTALRLAARVGADAALVSPVFPTRSASTNPPLGAARFTRLVQEARLPVIALGGVTARQARAIVPSGAAGLAAVDAFVKDA